jgi:ketosteroid isomerase-like protein
VIDVRVIISETAEIKQGGFYMGDFSSSEEEIGAANESWAEAIRNRDFDALMGHYADDVVVFDVPPPLSKQGKEIYRKSFENWLAGFEGHIKVEFKDTDITAGESIAFLHTLTRVSDVAESGTWVRVTVGFRKIEGKWLVTHEHVSVPIDIGAGGE